MKNLLLLFVLVNSLSHAMENSEEVAQGFNYLTHNHAYMAPEVFETEVAPIWYKHMSFLNRYLKKAFNEADIYHDAVFFNSYCYSHATYKLTYPQIKSLLCGGLAVLQKAKVHSADETGPRVSLQREYLQLLQEVQTFNNSNIAYRDLWEVGKWQEIRETIKSRQS